jgi:hypothetical protein
MSVLIIAAILVALTFTVSTSAFFARADLFDAENRAAAAALARGCVEAALVRRAEDPAYEPALGGDSVSIDATHSCSIVSIAPSDSDLLITTSAQSYAASSLLLATVHPKSDSEALDPAVPAFEILEIRETAAP